MAPFFIVDVKIKISNGFSTSRLQGGTSNDGRPVKKIYSVLKNLWKKFTKFETLVASSLIAIFSMKNYVKVKFVKVDFGKSQTYRS